MTEAKFVVREFTVRDLAYVASTWTAGMHRSCICHKSIARSLFFAKYANPKVAQCLGTPDTRVLVACLPDAPDVILGYIVYTPPVTVHWIHTKPAFYRQGIARELWRASGLPRLGAIATSYSRSIEKLAERLGIVHDPFQEVVPNV
jgi:ribosomal protein S18 acetylase RimI-like enzyme